MSILLRAKQLLLLLAILWFSLGSAVGQPIIGYGSVGEGYVDAMAFTHDGKFLYSTDYLILECDPMAGKFEKLHFIHESRTFAIAAFPHDFRVAIATADGWLYVWDRQSDVVLTSARFFTGEPMIDGFDEGIPKITISESGDLVALVYGSTYWNVDNRLTLYDAETLTPIPPPPGGGTYRSAVPAVFSPDGFELYAASREGDAWPANQNVWIIKWNLLSDTAEIVEDGFNSLYLNALSCETDGLRYGLGSHEREYCDRSCCCLTLLITTSRVDWSSWLKLPDAPVAFLTKGTYSESRCGESCFREHSGFAGAVSAISPGGKYLIRARQLTELASGTVISDKAPNRAVFNHDATMVAGIRVVDELSNYSIQFMLPAEGRVISEIPIDYGFRYWFGPFTVNETARSITEIQDEYAIRYDLDSGNSAGSTLLPSIYFYTFGAITSLREDFSAAYTSAGAILGDGDGLTTHTLLLPGRSVSSACVNPSNNRLLLVASELLEYEVNVDDFARTSLTRRYEAIAGDRSVYEDAAYTPDGEFLLAASGVVRKFSTADGSLVGEYHLDLPCHSLKIDPSGSYMVCGVHDRTSRLLQIYRLDSMERVGDFSVPERGFDFLGDGLVFLTAEGRLWQTDSGAYLGSIRPTSRRGIQWVVGSRTSDMVWLGEIESILGWRIPAERLIQHPDEIAVDQLLWRQHVVQSPDRNGDGVLDVADVLLANQSVPPSASAAGNLRVPSPERRGDSESRSLSIEEKLLPPESRPLTLSHAAQLDPPAFLREE